MKLLLFLLLLAGFMGCGSKPSKKIYCLDLPEGIVTSRTYYPLGFWGHIEVFANGRNASSTLSGSYWFDRINTGDTITHNNQP
jgi:hypothetical protein